MDIRDNPARVGSPKEYDREDTRPQFNSLPIGKQIDLASEFTDSLTEEALDGLVLAAISNISQFREYVADVIVRCGKNDDFVL